MAIPLIVATRRARGPAAIAGVRHACIAGFLACVAGSAAGIAVISALLPTTSGKALDVAVALLATACAVVAFFAVAVLLDRGDLRAIARRAASRAMRPGGKGRHAARP
jgi:putative peptidoglycan lipid II flippase